MKRTKMLAFALSAAIMVMGAGYAAWNETITINNNLETGELKVQFVKTGLHPYVTGFDDDYSQPDKITTSLTHSPYLTTIDIKNIYPGATALFETRIENLGSIPAQVDNVEVNLPTGNVLNDKIIARGMVLLWSKDPVSGLPIIKKAEGLPIETGIPLTELQTYLNNMTKNWQVNPGEFITFDVTNDYANQLATLKDFEAFDPNGNHSLFLTLPSDAGNETQEQSLQFQIKFKFKQWNK